MLGQACQPIQLPDDRSSGGPPGWPPSSCAMPMADSSRQSQLTITQQGMTTGPVTFAHPRARAALGLTRSGEQVPGSGEVITSPSPTPERVEASLEWFRTLSPGRKHDAAEHAVARVSVSAKEEVDQALKDVQQHAFTAKTLILQIAPFPKQCRHNNSDPASQPVDAATPSPLVQAAALAKQREEHLCQFQPHQPRQRLVPTSPSGPSQGLVPPLLQPGQRHRSGHPGQPDSRRGPKPHHRLQDQSQNLPNQMVASIAAPMLQHPPPGRSAPTPEQVHQPEVEPKVPARSASEYAAAHSASVAAATTASTEKSIAAALQQLKPESMQEHQAVEGGRATRCAVAEAAAEWTKREESEAYAKVEAIGKMADHHLATWEEQQESRTKAPKEAASAVAAEVATRAMCTTAQHSSPGSPEANELSLGSLAGPHQRVSHTPSLVRELTLERGHDRTQLETVLIESHRTRYSKPASSLSCSTRSVISSAKPAGGFSSSEQVSSLPAASECVSSQLSISISEIRRLKAENQQLGLKLCKLKGADLSDTDEPTKVESTMCNLANEPQAVAEIQTLKCENLRRRMMVHHLHELNCTEEQNEC